MFKDFIEKVKDWLNKSWSIFIARLEVLTGILVGAVTGIDWSALASLDWSQGIKSTNALIVAGLLIVKGIVSEIGRRSGTVSNENYQLIPVNLVDKVEKTKK